MKKFTVKLKLNTYGTEFYLPYLHDGICKQSVDQHWNVTGADYIWVEVSNKPSANSLPMEFCGAAVTVDEIQHWVLGAARRVLKARGVVVGDQYHVAVWVPA